MTGNQYIYNPHTDLDEIYKIPLKTIFKMYVQKMYKKQNKTQHEMYPLKKKLLT